MYRQTEIDFWTDPDFEKSSYLAKSFYLYLLSNSMSNLIGVYRFHRKTAQAHTNLTTEEIEQALSELSDLGKIALEKEWVWVKGSGKRLKGKDQIKGGFKLWNELPDDLNLKKVFALKYKQLTTPSLESPQTLPIKIKDKSKVKIKDESKNNPDFYRDGLNNSFKEKKTFPIPTGWCQPKTELDFVQNFLLDLAPKLRSSPKQATPLAQSLLKQFSFLTIKWAKNKIPADAKDPVAYLIDVCRSPGKYITSEDEKFGNYPSKLQENMDANSLGNIIKNISKHFPNGIV